MISINNLPQAAINELLENNNQPFIRKTFKRARVLAHDVAQTYTNLFYNATAYLCAPFAPNTARYYSSLHSHGIKKLKLHKYCKYGNAVIDFSTNSAAKSSNIPSAGGHTLETFQKVYRLRNLDWQSKQGYSINRNNLQNLNSEGGSCAGMSAHFILCYLKEIEAGKTSAEAVQRIAPLYVDGAPDSAQLAQIFYASQTNGMLVMLKKKKEESVDEIKQIGNDWINKIKETEKNHSKQSLIKIVFFPIYFFVYFLKSVCVWLGLAKPEMSLMEQFDAIEKVYSGRVNGSVDKLKKWVDENSNTDLELMGLSVDNKYEYEAAKMKTDLTGEGVQKIVQACPNGSYSVSISSEDEQKNAHAIVFIKTDGPDHFLFDPNYGTIRLDSQESGIDIWKIAEEYFPKSNGSCSIKFSCCRLSNGQVYTRST